MNPATPSDHEFREAVRTWVRGRTKSPEDEITDRTALFEQRHLRSVHLPELLLLLERLRGAPIDVDGLGAGDFRDIDTIVSRFAQPRAAS
jgi:hypothetical protein